MLDDIEMTTNKDNESSNNDETYSLYFDDEFVSFLIEYDHSNGYVKQKNRYLLVQCYLIGSTI